MSENEWLRMLAGQMKLGVSPTEADLIKLAQALPAIMAELQDLEVRLMLAELQLEDQSAKIAKAIGGYHE